MRGLLLQKGLQRELLDGPDSASDLLELLDAERTPFVPSPGPWGFDGFLDCGAVGFVDGNRLEVLVEEDEEYGVPFPVETNPPDALTELF